MKNGLTNNEIDWLRDALKACTDEGRGWLYGDSAPEGGLLVIKAKLEIVAMGDSSVEAEFLANLITADGATVAQHVLPAVARMYETGKMPTVPLLGSGSSEP